MIERLRQNAVRIAVGILVVAAMAAHQTGRLHLPAVEWLDRTLYDLFAVLSAPREPHPRVLIVELDASARSVGGPSWNRGRLAQLIEKLVDRYGAAAVVLDHTLDAPDASDGLPVLERLATTMLKNDEAFQTALAMLRPELDHDARLTAALAGRPVVLAFALHPDPVAPSVGALPDPIGSGPPRESSRVTEWRAFRANLPALQRAAPAGGHLQLLPDSDGLVRRMPALVRIDGALYEALALATFRRVATSAGTSTGVSVHAATALRVGEDAMIRLAFRATDGGLRRLSGQELLTDRLPAAALADRVVLITDPAQAATVATPIARRHPVAEIHAGLIAAILDGALPSEPPDASRASLALLLVAGVLLAIGLPLVSKRAASLIAVGVALAAWVAAGVLWHAQSVVFAIGATVFAVVTILLLNLGFRSLIQAWHERRLTAVYGEYVTAERVSRMARDPDPHRYSTEGRNEVLSVMFADLRNFTQIAEGMAPELLRRYLVEYLTEMSAVVHQFHGTVDKYMGDSVMAFWGAPMADPHHAANAVRAALEMQRVVARLQARAPARDRAGLIVGIGINTGLASVGDMGSKLRRTYTAIGDPVNLASRLESLTKYYGVGIIIGEPTRELVPDLVCREIDLVRVKGRDEEVAIYEPIDFRGAVDDRKLEALALWNQMIVSYRHCRWDEAQASLEALRGLEPASALYELYAERIARYRVDPPPANWDGVMVFDRK